MKLRINKKITKIVIFLFLLIPLFTGLYFGLKYKAELERAVNNKIFSPLVLQDNYSLLLNTLAQQEINAVNFTFLDNSTVLASLSAGTKVLFSLNKDVIPQAASLQLILSRFRIEGRKVNKIDLRFKNVFIE